MRQDQKQDSTFRIPKIPRLGINIDHIATLRQLRGTPYPNLLAAAQLAQAGGADQITVHLREDRRHIQPEDVEILRRRLELPLNLEMAVSPAMVRFALKIRPDWVCLVPEKRQELTTEGGLDVSKNQKNLKQAISKLQKAGIQVSCFIEPSVAAVRASSELGADAVEIHTGRYCNLTQALKKPAQSRISAELLRIQKAADLSHSLGIHAHAGHGFDFENVREVVELNSKLNPSDPCPLIEEYNIGHAIVCRAVVVGLESAVREMKSAILAP